MSKLEMLSTEREFDRQKVLARMKHPIQRSASSHSILINCERKSILLNELPVEDMYHTRFQRCNIY